MTRILAGALLTILVGSSQLAVADSFSGCSVSEPQLVQFPTATFTDSAFVFEACGFFWSVDPSSTDSETARDLALEAFTSDRTIGVQCGATGIACSSQNLAVFDDGLQVTRQVFALDGISLGALVEPPEPEIPSVPTDPGVSGTPSVPVAPPVPGTSVSPGISDGPVTP